MRLTVRRICALYQYDLTLFGTVLFCRSLHDVVCLPFSGFGCLPPLHHAVHGCKLLWRNKFIWNISPKIRIEPRQPFRFRNVPCIFPFSHNLRLRVHFLLHIRIAPRGAKLIGELRLHSQRLCIDQLAPCQKCAIFYATIRFVVRNGQRRIICGARISSDIHGAIAGIIFILFLIR